MKFFFAFTQFSNSFTYGFFHNFKGYCCVYWYHHERMAHKLEQGRSQYEANRGTRLGKILPNVVDFFFSSEISQRWDASGHQNIKGLKTIKKCNIDF